MPAYLSLLRKVRLVTLSVKINAYFPFWRQYSDKIFHFCNWSIITKVRKWRIFLISAEKICTLCDFCTQVSDYLRFFEIWFFGESI